jgi:LPS sulfotransferase NodH
VAAQSVLESRVLQHVLRADELGGAGGARAASRHVVRSGALRARLERPVFVVAAPRSGSTLLFETLAVSPQLCTLGGEAHWLVEGVPELRPGAPGIDSNRLDGRHATPAVAHRIDEKVREHLVDARRRPVAGTESASLRWLEKTPKNALRIPFFERLYTDALFVFLWRDPRENLSSIMEAWRSGHWVTYPELDGWDGSWSMLLPPGWQRLRGRPLEEIAAFQWQRANEIVLEDLLARPRERWMAVGYADLLRDPAATVRRICDFAGLEFDAALESRTGGTLPPSRHTLTAPAAEKWRRNEAEVLRVLPALEGTWRRLESLGAITPRSDSRNAR